MRLRSIAKWQMNPLPDKRNIVAWMVLPLRRYAQFTGRSGRREFWFYSLFLFLGYCAIFLIGVAVAMATDSEAAIGAIIVAGWGLFFLVNFVPGLALTVRRLHDLDVSRWLVLAIYGALLFFNILGWIGYMVSMSVPGHRGANRHGPPLSDESAAEIFA